MSQTELKQLQKESKKELSKSDFWSISLFIPEELLDIISSILMDAGASGLEYKDNETASWPLTNISLPLGYLLISGYYELKENENNLKNVCTKIKSFIVQNGFEPKGYNIVKVEDLNWVEKWKEWFKPIPINKDLCIIPDFFNEVDYKKYKHIIKIKPGQGFGTGSHPTTKLCLVELVSIINKANIQKVIDVGTGSGILSIAADIFGDLECLGIDNDPVALENAKINLLINNSKKVKLQLSGPELIDFSFDLVIANILKNPLIAMSTTLINLTSHGGILLLSGLLETQMEQILDCYCLNKYSTLELQAVRYEQGWISLRFIKN